jgi:hypothetical protein
MSWITLGWFPQEYAEQFFIIKGLLALLSTIVYMCHMMQKWPRVECVSQQLRYISLLTFSVLITGSSVEQVHDEMLVNWRNLGAMAATVLLLVTAIVSIVHERHGRCRHSNNGSSASEG